MLRAAFCDGEDLQFLVCRAGFSHHPLRLRERHLSVVLAVRDQERAPQILNDPLKGHAIEELVDAVKEVLENTPPEIVSDIMQRGIFLCGGGALIRGLPQYLTVSLGVPVVVAPDPLTAVVRGTAVILDDMDSYREALLRSDDELVPTE